MLRIAAARMPEGRVDGAHPLRIALGQVVVDRHEVDVVARQRVQVERHRRDERLPLAGLHLGDVALVEDDSRPSAGRRRAACPRATAPPRARRRTPRRRARRAASPFVEPLLELDGLPGELLVGPRTGVDPAQRARTNVSDLREATTSRARRRRHRRRARARASSGASDGARSGSRMPLPIRPSQNTSQSRAAPRAGMTSRRRSTIGFAAFFGTRCGTR